jgi:DNA-binding IclR family transcriptional regulator
MYASTAPNASVSRILATLVRRGLLSKSGPAHVELVVTVRDIGRRDSAFRQLQCAERE